MLQYPDFIPADGMVLRPGVFGYGRLLREGCAVDIQHMLVYVTYVSFSTSFCYQETHSYQDSEHVALASCTRRLVTTVTKVSVIALM